EPGPQRRALPPVPLVAEEEVDLSLGEEPFEDPEGAVGGGVVYADDLQRDIERTDPCDRRSHGGGLVVDGYHYTEHECVVLIAHPGIPIDPESSSVIPFAHTGHHGSS